MAAIPNFQPGLTKAVQKLITREDTALNFGSGKLTNLLATPTLTALMIEAAVNAVDPQLPDGYITVGRSVNVSHGNPTVEGMTVTVEAKLASVENMKLTFDVKAYDELGEIGTGNLTRYIVNKDTLMNKVNERCGVLETKNL